MASAEYPGPTCGKMSAASGSWWVFLRERRETLEVSENGGHLVEHWEI